MSNQVSAASTIKLSLPPGIKGHALAEAKRIGISLQDFIRMLLATYFANSTAIRSVRFEHQFYNQAIKEIKQGKFTKVVSKDELDSYLNQLHN